jgi:nucleoside-diphosphate-sugar epimerase
MADNVLVSGASGLLGAHLLVELLKDDQNIVALYRSESSKQEAIKVLKFYGQEDKLNRITWEKGDISDVELLQDLMTGINHVYHCAAFVSFDPSDAVKLHKVNVEGTQNMVNAALQCGVDKFVHVSSTAAIGVEEDASISTEKTKWNNEEKHTFYAKSKYSAEREVWRSMEEGLDAVIVNPCVIIGPGNIEQSSGTLFSTIGKGLKFYTNGANAFVDARDVSSIMVLLMNSSIQNERFLCVGENMKFRVLFKKIAEAMAILPPRIEASKLMTSIAWRVMKIGSFFTRKPAKITSESARASHRTMRYSNKKIKDYLEFDFTPIDKSIVNTVNYIEVTQKLK